MKKRFLFAALLFSILMTAQTEKGTLTISGKTGIGFNSTTIKHINGGNSSDGLKTSSFNISPSLGYFIIDNLSIGLDADYKNVTTKNGSFLVVSDIAPGFELIDEKITQKTLSIVPTATYFFSKGKTRPYANIGIGFANTKQDNTYSEGSPSADKIANYSYSDNGLVWSAGGGLAYFISKTISFDLGLEYSEYTYKEKGIKTKSDVFGVNIGISVFLK